MHDYVSICDTRMPKRPKCDKRMSPGRQTTLQFGSPLGFFGIRLSH
jgi:hypothetical protein